MQLVDPHHDYSHRFGVGVVVPFDEFAVLDSHDDQDMADGGRGSELDKPILNIVQVEAVWGVRTTDIDHWWWLR